MFDSQSFDTGSLSPLSFEFGEVVAQVLEQATGGFWFAYEQEQFRRAEARRRLKKKKEQAQRIQDNLIRELAQAERDLEEEELRRDELKKLLSIAEDYESEIESLLNEKALIAFSAARLKQTFSALERFERELRQQQDEEDFLIQSAFLLL